MNRARPRRTSTRQGRSSEATPTGEVEESLQEADIEETNEASPRRSTRNLRGSPTPQLASNDASAVDETDRPSEDGGAQPQHAQEGNDTDKTDQERDSVKDEEKMSGPEESKDSEQAVQANDAPRITQPPASASEVNGKGSPSRLAPISLDENATAEAENSLQKAPAGSQQNDSFKNDGDEGVDRGSATVKSLSKLNDAKPGPPDAEPQTATDPGDDHAADLDKKNESGDGQRSKAMADEEAATESKRGADAASDEVSSFLSHKGHSINSMAMMDEAPITDVESHESVSSTNQTVPANSATEVGEANNVASTRSESRTVSVGSRSVLDTANGEEVDHEELEKMPTSPQMSMDSIEESHDHPNGATDEFVLTTNENERLDLSDAEEKSRLVTSQMVDHDNSGETVENETSPDENDAPPFVPTTDAGKTDSASQLLKVQQHSHPEVKSSLKLRDVLFDPLPMDGVATSNDDENKTTNSTTAGTAGHSRDEERTDTKGTDMSREASLPKKDESKKESDTSWSSHGSHLSKPRVERTLSSSAVVSDAFAIDIRPTAKISSRPKRLSRDSSISSARADLSESRKNGNESITANNSQESKVHVNNDASSNPRKRILYDDENEPGELPQNIRQGKRQRNDMPAVVSSTALQSRANSRSSRRTRIKGRRASSRTVSRVVQPGFTDFETTKIRLYDLASKVYRGEGPEQRFATYWEALSRFVSSHRRATAHCSELDLKGVHEVLDSFLATKQMRKLHNRLIMGLLAQCTKEHASRNGLHNVIPREWQERIRPRNSATDPDVKETDLSLVIATETTLDLTDFKLQSDVWTAGGKEPLISRNCGEVESIGSSASGREATQLHRHSACLPGALSVDPRVRGIVREESGLKVSELAVWLLIVSVREYAQSVLKNTISSMTSIDSKQSLGPAEFAPYAIHSGNMGKPQSSTDSFPSDSEDSKKTKTSHKDEKTPTKSNADEAETAGGKKRRITSLDIASALTAARLSRGGPVAGSTARVSYERCCHVSFNENQLSMPPAFDSVHSFVVDSMESASKKQRYERLASKPLAASPVVPATLMSPDTRIETPHSNRSSSGCSRSSLGELGKDANDLDAMKARAAAAAAAMQMAAVQAAVGVVNTLPPATTTTITPTFPSTPPTNSRHVGHSGSKNGNITPPPTTGLKTPPSSVSPRGRGKGFGVKDLAAMRARSGNTPPKQSSTPSPQPVGTPTGQNAMAATQNGAGKELRRLQEVQAKKSE